MRNSNPYYNQYSTVSDNSLCYLNYRSLTSPLTTGTGILKLLKDYEEDLIIEESQESFENALEMACLDTLQNAF